MEIREPCAAGRPNKCDLASNRCRSQKKTKGNSPSASLFFTIWSTPTSFLLNNRKEKHQILNDSQFLSLILIGGKMSVGASLTPIARLRKKKTIDRYYSIVLHFLSLAPPFYLPNRTTTTTTKTTCRWSSFVQPSRSTGCRADWPRSGTFPGDTRCGDPSKRSREKNRACVIIISLFFFFSPSFYISCVLKYVFR